MKSYNTSYHRSIKIAPFQVTKKNEKSIHDILFPHHEYIKKFKYSINDTVRISKNKSFFEKGYTPNWTEETFVISHTIPRDPVVYKIKDLNGDIVEGVIF